jgi:hypothetical protein
MSAQSSLQDDDSADNFSHRDRLVNEFMRQRPAAGHQSRISSWSDPFSARDMLDGGDSRSRKQLKPSRLGHSSMIMDEDIISSAYPSTTGTPEDELEGPSWRMFQEDRRRHRTHPPLTFLSSDVAAGDIASLSEMITRMYGSSQLIACASTWTSAGNC